MGMLMRVLLALVLVELAVGAKGGDCTDGGLAAICEVMATEGEVATLMCGQEKSSIIDSGISNTTPVEIIVESEDTLNDYVTKDYIAPGYVNTFGEETNLTLDDNEEGQLYNDGLNNTYNENNKTIPVYITDRSSMYNGSENNPLSDKSMLGYTALKVMLNSTVYFLDLRPFPYVKSITINTLNNTLLKTCAASNVSDFSIADSQLTDFPFIKSFSGVKQLNLSKNNIKYLSFKDLPSSIKSLDLSFNSIVFGKNIRLPESLQCLDISYNNIMLEETVVFKGNLSSLSLRGSKLLFIPGIEMVNLKVLDLSENKISSLHPYVFRKLTSLNNLNLRKNYLACLRETEFEGLSNLEILDISENKITELSSATFQYLTNLVTLRLSGNVHLGTIPNVKAASLLFGTGQRLQIIEASNTSLTWIPPTLTRSVKKLQLSENAINSIQCGELDNFPLLQSVDLSSNRIAVIEDDALGRLDFLTELDLSNNRLTSIPRSLPIKLDLLDMRCNLVGNLNTSDFLGIQSLRILLLSKNKISIIEDGSFGQLSSLEVLDLSDNPIKSLSRNSFIGLMRLKIMHLAVLKELIYIPERLSFPAPECATLEVLNIESSPVLANQLMDDQAALTTFHELSELNLNDCNLSSLPSDLPNYLPRLHKLYLNGNPLNCAEIMWLVKWLHSENISMQGSNRYSQEIYSINDMCCESCDLYQKYEKAVCASPEYLSGKEIHTLEEEDFSDLKLTTPPLTATKPSVIMEHYPQKRSPDSGYSKASSNNDVIEISSSPYASVQQSTNPISEEMLLSEGTTQQMHTTSEIKSDYVTSTPINIIDTLEKPTVNYLTFLKYIQSIKGDMDKERNSIDNKQNITTLTYNMHPNEKGENNSEHDKKMKQSKHSNDLVDPDTTPGTDHGVVLLIILLSCFVINIVFVLYKQMSNYNQEQEDRQILRLADEDVRRPSAPNIF